MQKKWLTGFPDRESQKKLWQIMKLTIVLLVGFMMTVSANSYSQKTKLNVNLNNTTIKDLFGYIEQNSEFVFLYRSEDFNTNKKVSVEAKDATINEVLDQALKGEKVEYDVYERQVVIRKAGEPAAQQQQKNIISGSVHDTKGQPIPGVTVLVKGTTTGITTDIDGNFRLSLPVNAKILAISFMGMKTQEFPIGNQSVLKVVLEEESFGVDEVIVVGYGKQKRVTVVGAITTINTKELRQSPTTNLSNALAGRMSGMMVNQFSGGEPGVDQSAVFVRGMSTYNNQNPIVIVDGIERDFQYLNPDEVETFSILKDASATAVYGVRGANGVILVTTRRGKVMEKANVTFKASSGVSSPIKFPQYLGSADYAMLYNEAHLNDNPNTTSALFSQTQIDNYRKAKGDNSDGLGYNTNLFDYAFKPSMQQDYSLNIQGGTKRRSTFF